VLGYIQQQEQESENNEDNLAKQLAGMIKGKN
jgi:hypothetical protein